MGELSRLIYVDDSGSERFGFIVFGWVECAPTDWSTALATWLALRRELSRNHGIPISQELHCTDYINGRGRISQGMDGQRRKQLGRAVAERCLATLAGCPQITVGSAFRRTTARGPEYHAERASTYRRLVDQWNSTHHAEGTLTAIYMDGDGSDPTYASAHRSLDLDRRAIIEDPHFIDSRRSHVVQMADLVAYVAYTHLDRHDGNRFGWDWYSKWLSDREPLEL